MSLKMQKIPRFSWRDWQAFDERKRKEEEQEEEEKKAEEAAAPAHSSWERPRKLTQSTLELSTVEIKDQAHVAGAWQQFIGTSGVVARRAGDWRLTTFFGCSQASPPLSCIGVILLDWYN